MILEQAVAIRAYSALRFFWRADAECRISPRASGTFQMRIAARPERARCAQPSNPPSSPATAQANRTPVPS